MRATLLCIAMLLAPSIARADSNEAIAEQLFLEGQRLLEAGKIHEACERLSMSQHLDAATGTLLNLALCHEREGKTATAWSEYQDAAAQAANAGQRDREAFAREHAAALSREIAKVRIALLAPPEGTSIKLDGAVLPLGLLNTDMPIDPGDHALSITAPGKKDWSAPLHVARGAQVARVDVTLEDAAPEPTTTTVKAAKDASPPPAHSSLSGRRAAGFIAGGAGIAAVGVGVALLVRASLFDSRSDDEAAKARQSSPPNADYRAASLSDHDAAIGNQTAGLICGGVGLAALGAGLYLLFTHDKANSAFIEPDIGAKRAGVNLRFAF